MNRRQKQVQAQFLNDEEEVIRRLESTYKEALKDIEKKAQSMQDEINRLGTMANLSTDADEKARLLSMQQSKVYQKQYQDAMKKQVGSILDNMQVEEFKTVSEYLQKCYEDGFIGTMYDLQGQGIPLCFPLDQEAMVTAVQLDSKISKGLYASIGENVAELKKRITAEVSRGIANGSDFHQIAKQLRGHMMGNYTQKTGGALYRSELIARTEGHRIQVQSAMDACYKAKDKGADVVKQWDSTLDSKTRESHVAVDGEIRELDEKFSNGLLFPGDPDGGAAEVCNCRCALLQRARWALGYDFTKMDNESGELVEIKADEYDEFKQKYFAEAKKIQNRRMTSAADEEQFERYKAVLGNVPKTLEEFRNIKYNDGNKWDELKYQYRTVNRYEVVGKVPSDKILELDNVAFYEKKKGFDYSSFSSKQRKKISKNISNGGNAASMEFDGKVYFSHSKFGLPGSFEHSLYKGEHPAITLTKDRIFKVKDLGDGVPRQFDTEAKFLEFVASQKKPEDKFTVTILSEKHICESCQGVVEQFKQKFPNSTVNIVSGKLGYNGDEKGLHTWKHRKKVK